MQYPCKDIKNFIIIFAQKQEVMVKILGLLSLFFIAHIAIFAQEKRIDSLLIDPDNLNFELQNEMVPHPSLEGTLKTDNILPGDFANQTGWLLWQFDLPCNGKVISHFGPRHGRLHAGIDLKMPKGDTIKASFDGIVSRSQYYYGYGNLIVVDHGNKIETYYGHLSGYISHRGDSVKKGQAIGLAGATGRATTSHLHFEVRENGRPYNPEFVFNFDEQKVKDEIWSITNLASLQKEQNQKDNKLAQNSTEKVIAEKHIVRYGDSLWKIARRYGTSIAYLCKLNNLTENTVLNLGMIVKLK